MHEETGQSLSGTPDLALGESTSSHLSSKKSQDTIDSGFIYSFHVSLAFFSTNFGNAVTVSWISEALYGILFFIPLLSWVTDRL